MRQLVQSARSGAVELIEVPDPKPGRRDVLVRTSWSLISPGTEQAVTEIAGKRMLGKALARPEQARKVLDKARTEGVDSAIHAVRARLDDPLTPGYSSAGVVEATGAEVAGIRPGDVVACFGANVACHAERVAVPEPLCLPLPRSLDPRLGAFAALGGVAAHGIRIAGVEAGSIVVIVGLGLVGQIAAQLVTAAGGRAVGVDPVAERVALSRRLGAAGGAVLGEDDVERLVDTLSRGDGADAVVITASTRDSRPVELAALVARDRATVAVVGDVRLIVPRAPFYAKELQLRVSRSYGPGRYDATYEEQGVDYPIGYVRWTERRLIQYFLDEAEAGRVRLRDLITHEFPVERAAEAYDALRDPARLAILIRYGGRSEPVAQPRVSLVARPPDRGGRLAVALIGPGTFARSTLLPLLEKADAELVAVVGRSPARTVAAAERWGATYAATEPQEILSDESVDVVVIATRHDSHAELAARALEAGKAVFVEKPLAIDHEGLARLRPLLEAGGRLVVGFNREFAVPSRRLREHFRGRVEPMYIAYRVNAGYLEPDHWLRDRSQGGGRLVGEACHFVDYCSFVIDRPLRTIQVTRLPSAPRTLEGDNFQLTLRYEDGSLATVAYIAAGDPSMPKERIEALGGGRSAMLEDFRRVLLFGGESRRRRRFPFQDKGHARLLETALGFFREGGAPPIPYERLIETTEATLRARDAMDAGSEAPFSLAGA